MEKVMYTVWKPATIDAEAFREILIGPLFEALEEVGIRGYRVCVSDAEACKSKLRVVSTRPQPDAFLSIWMNSTMPLRRDPIEDVIAEHVDRFHGYLVTESEPYPNTEHLPEKPGDRTFGMNQIVMLKVPNRISWEYWLETWHGSHGIMGMGTQSTFGYRQNVIVRALTYAAPHYDAFVEENFPEQSMTDIAHYHDSEGKKKEEWDPLIEKYYPGVKAAGDGRDGKERWEINFKILTDSVDRFIDRGQTSYIKPKIDCMPFSEYIMKGI